MCTFTTASRLAPDDRTVVIRWEGLYPEANMLRDDFQALPRHVLEPSFRQDPPDIFTGHPFWSTEYLGLGPYRVERWEPGAQIDAVAFPGHALGAPKIERVVIRFVSDENTALTNLLAESVHMVADRAIRDEHAQILNREWGATHKGVVLPLISNVRYVLTQFRPEVVSPSVLLDVRVRKALAYSIDKQALSDGLFEGQALVANRFLSPDIPYGAEADRAVTMYPFDPRRSEQLMQEVGYTRDRDGMFAMSRGERFSSQVWQLSGAQYEREVAIFVDTWQRAGFDVDAFMLSPTQLRDGRLRASFPGLYIVQGGGSTEARLDFLTAALTPTAANRYNGNNRGGWLSPAYERLWAEFNTTLDRSQRNQQAIEMLKLLSDELPAIPTYFNIAPAAHLATLTGPEVPARIPDPLINWNVYEWDWR
jgi:peptide/nickel transport system substrate-binding protein